MDDEIHYPEGFSLNDILAWGSCGMICLDSSSKTVVKSAHDTQAQTFIDVEKRIYERFRKHDGHPGILRYYGTYDSTSIRLEYAPNHDLRSYLAQNASTISTYQRHQWALQIAESLRFIHRMGVIHGDLTCANVFLDKDLNAKVADFSGSSLDKSPLLVHVTTSHAHPFDAGSESGDIFALGSLFYEIMTGRAPYVHLTEKETEERFSKLEFPETDSLGSVGSVIGRCWKGQYDNASKLVQDVQGICSAFSPLHSPPR